MVMYSGGPSLYSNTHQVVYALSASSDGDILYCCLLGGVLPGNSLILCLIFMLLWYWWWFKYISKLSTQIIPMVSLGVPRLPTSKSTTCPHGIKRLNRMDKCEPSNCTTINLLANGVQRSKFNMHIELQGKPARRQCPPGTLTRQVQAYQSIWGLQVQSQSNPSTISWDRDETMQHSTTADKA